MPDNMVMFDKGGLRFIMRAAGIAIRNDRVLLVTAPEIGCWFLPGGRVEMGEESRDTLLREMREELSTDVSVGRLLWVVENFFGENGKNYHELGLYHLITLPPSASVIVSGHHSCIDGLVTLTFQWFPLSEVAGLNLRPLFLRTALTGLPEHTEHIVWYAS